MKAVTTATLFAFVLALPGAVWAQDPPPAPDIGPSRSSRTMQEMMDAAAAKEPERRSQTEGVVPLKKGGRAPYRGLLVPEARFVELLEAENKARELAARLAAAERTAELVEQVYLTKLEQAAIVHWYDSPSLNRWFGIVIGAAIAGAAWGTAEVIKK